MSEPVDDAEEATGATLAPLRSPLPSAILDEGSGRGDGVRAVGGGEAASLWEPPFGEGGMPHLPSKEGVVGTGVNVSGRGGLWVRRRTKLWAGLGRAHAL